jgi:integrase
MSREAYGEGSVYQRKDGLWVASFITEDAKGKKKRVTVSAKTKALVRKKLREAQRRVEAGLPVKDSARNLESWSTYWAKTHLPNDPKLEPSTIALYEGLMVKHVIPRLGHYALKELKPSHVESLMDELQEVLAPSSIRNVYAAFKRCLASAVREGILARNVVASVDRPTVSRDPARKALLDDESVAIVSAVVGHRILEPLVLLDMATGLRRGELLGLQWSDIDFATGELKVQRQCVRDQLGLRLKLPKTAHGVRRLKLGKSTLEHLRKHRVAQAKERLSVGDAWADLDLVFATEAGGLLDPNNVSKWYKKACKSAGVYGKGKRGIHAQRHTVATALADSQPPHVIASTLGHASSTYTMDTYVSVMPKHAEDVADVLEQRLKG